MCFIIRICLCQGIRTINTNIERVTFVAKLLTRNNVAVQASFISPYIARRDKSREEIGNFVECFVKCSLEECENRDVKGMYAKARAGEIKEFTGISDPYEEPPNAEIVVETDKLTEQESVEFIKKRLVELGWLDESILGAGTPTPTPDSDSGSDDSGDPDEYSEEEEEKIKNRLKALGYY